MLDPNEVYELSALQLIADAESTDTTLGPVDAENPAIDEVVIYLRASYVVLDNAAVIKVSQDLSFNSNAKERYVLYFFSSPAAGQNYTVYRAIVDYDISTE